MEERLIWRRFLPGVSGTGCAWDGNADVLSLGVDVAARFSPFATGLFLFRFRFAAAGLGDSSMVTVLYLRMAMTRWARKPSSAVR